MTGANRNSSRRLGITFPEIVVWAYMPLFSSLPPDTCICAECIVSRQSVHLGWNLLLVAIKQRRLNSRQWFRHIAGIETDVVAVQYIPALWRMPKNPS